MPIFTTYGTVSSEGWSISAVVLLVVTTVIVAAVYFALIYRKGTELLNLPRVAPGLTQPSTSAPAPGSHISGLPIPAGPQPEVPRAHRVWFFSFVLAFIAWTWFYLFHVRPVLNAWVAQFITGYPMVLHLIPIIGLPVLILLGIKKAAGPAESAGK